jgi:hypothetical protein
MAAIVERTAPNMGRRMLVIGIAGLLLGGIAGGAVGWTIQHGVRSVGIGETLPAVRGELFSPEAVRALSGYAPTATQVAFSPEAVRALSGYAPTATQVAFSPEAVRALSG